MRAENKFTSFHMICKPTASAVENAVNQLKLVYLAMLAKIGYLFTKDFFVLLSKVVSPNYFGMKVHFVLCYMKHRKC